MAVFNEEFIFNNYIASDYITFDEAVDFLIETYNLPIDDAVFVVEDYIEEASAKDAYKQKEQGDRIYSQKRGMRITNHELNRPGRTVHTLNDEDMYNAAREYYYKDNLNLGKVNNVKPKTDKEKIRDATRSLSGSVPKYGANPKYSRDADKKAVEAYKRSTSKNPYKGIDIDKSVAGMDKKKADMVRRSLERGADLPESIKKRLVKKDEKESSGKRFENGVTFNGIKWFGDKKKDVYFHAGKLYDSKEDADKQRDRLKKMSTTTDPAEYHINRKEFLKDMGEKDYNGSIMYPVISSKTGTGKDGVFFRKSQKESIRDTGENSTSKSKSNKPSEYYHTSKAKGIKELTPTPKAGEGIFYPQSRIYASKGSPTYRNGDTMSSAEARADGYSRYKLKDISGKKINADDMADDNSKASYFKTSRTIKVDDIDDKSKASTDKKKSKQN